MKYEMILFDLDDTLFDFKRSESHALMKTLERFKIQHLYDEFHPTYKRHSHRLWEKYEAGHIDKDHLRVERFNATLTDFQIDRDPNELSDTYLELLPKWTFLTENALETVSQLAQISKVGAVTNGIASVQYHRLRASGLEDIFDFVVVSEDCGVAKPNAGFFEFTFQKAPEIEKQKTLIVGDRLETDILGGHRFGIDTCWYNPHKLENTLEFHPTYEIENLREILNFS